MGVGSTTGKGSALPLGQTAARRCSRDQRSGPEGSCQYRPGDQAGGHQNHDQQARADDLLAAETQAERTEIAGAGALRRQFRGQFPGRHLLEVLGDRKHHDRNQYREDRIGGRRRLAHREEPTADRHQSAGQHQQPDRLGRSVGEPGDVDLEQHG